MASQGPPRPPGPNAPILGGRPLAPHEVEQRMAEEAKKHGMSVEQFKQIQAENQRRLEQEAAKVGMTPQQFIQMQRQKIVEEAAKAGVTPEQFIQMIQQQAFQQQQNQAQMQARAGQQQGGQPPGAGQPPQQGAPALQPGQQRHEINLNSAVEPKLDALAVAKFLRSQDLKTRTCVFNGQRKDMFKVKRAFRALQSDAYKKARTKDPLLPAVTNELEARNALQLLPINMLALCVGKKQDEHVGHSHKKKKRTKGLWDVGIEPQQAFEPMMHYMWIYEPPSIKNKVYAALTLLAVFTVVLFPLWPVKMRQGVWYLSVGAMFLLGAFFAMAIFRLILFCVTIFAAPPGLWLFPNLFEDVGFFDSFKPVWGWQETKKGKSKKKGGKSAAEAAVAAAVDAVSEDIPSVGEKVPQANVNGGVIASGSEPASAPTVTSVVPTKRHVAPTVEEADDE